MINAEIPCIACMDEYAKKAMIMMFIMILVCILNDVDGVPFIDRR